MEKPSNTSRALIHGRRRCSARFLPEVVKEKATESHLDGGGLLTAVADQRQEIATDVPSAGITWRNGNRKLGRILVCRNRAITSTGERNRSKALKFASNLREDFSRLAG